MLTEITLVGSVVGVFVGLLEVWHRVDEWTPGRLTTEGAVRAAMEGREAAAVRAEFRRLGVTPPERRPTSLGFGL